MWRINRIIIYKFVEKIFHSSNCYTEIVVVVDIKSKMSKAGEPTLHQKSNLVRARGEEDKRI